MTADARYSRQDPRAGFVSVAKCAGKCRECGGAAGPRRTFCGDACIHAWKLRSQPSYAAEHVLKRDAGVCAECALDCVALARELVKLRHESFGTRTRRAPYSDERVYDFELKGDDAFATRVRELGLKGERAALRRRLWEMDHVVPVVEGGGSCGLDNLRTLCWRCHAKVTAELAKRRAERRKAAR